MIDTTRRDYGKRIRHLTRVLEDVSGDRDLAMYRAHQHGMSYEQVALLALATVDQVRETIVLLRLEEDVDGWDDGPVWVGMHPTSGW